jgi:hypothetical protein
VSATKQLAWLIAKTPHLKHSVVFAKALKSATKYVIMIQEITAI